MKAELWCNRAFGKDKKRTPWLRAAGGLGLGVSKASATAQAPQTLQQPLPPTLDVRRLCGSTRPRTSAMICYAELDGQLQRSRLQAGPHGLANFHFNRARRHNTDCAPSRQTCRRDKLSL